MNYLFLKKIPLSNKFNFFLKNYFFLLFFLFFILSISYIPLYGYEEDYFILIDSPIQIRGGFFYDFSFFDISKTTSSQIYENKYYYYFASILLNFSYFFNYLSEKLNKSSTNIETGIFYIGLNFFQNSFDFYSYDLTLRGLYINKFLLISGKLNFETFNFKTYINSLIFNIKLDFYPYFFASFFILHSFYPMKLFTYYENLSFLNVEQKYSLKFETGIYFYQNEISINYSYYEKYLFNDEINYDFLKSYDISLSLKLIPTYFNVGYKIYLGSVINFYSHIVNNVSQIDNIFYYYFYLKGGVIYRIINNFYIIGEIGYNFFYIQKFGLSLKEIKPLSFKIETLINI
jgi:hypothetical protein